MKNKNLWILSSLSLIILLSITFLVLWNHNQTNTEIENQPSAPKKTSLETPTKILPEAKIYMTLMGHIENQEIYADCLAYPGFREKLLTTAKIIHSHGYTMNLQISYEFLEGVLNCETMEIKAETDNTNIVDFLAREYGFEIDAHHEGGWDWEGDENYADTKYIGNLVTTEMSEVVGGVVWDHREQFIQLEKGEPGKRYPDFIWQPKIITAAVNHIHHLGDFSKDDPNSGVWIPAGTDGNFTNHDTNGTLIYVGTGPHTGCDKKRHGAFEDDMDYTKILLSYIDLGKINNQLLTVTVPLPQKILFGENPGIEELMDELDQLKKDSRIQITTYSEVVNAWQQDYDS